MRPAAATHARTRPPLGPVTIIITIWNYRLMASALM